MEKDSDILNKINFPDDLKKCSVAQLPEICHELRQFIIQELSENPGHLAASLGTVELSVALHYTLHTPYDKIVWDVGHQAYGHKILTGRRDVFNTNRKLHGISGFPNPEESIYDAFIAGHASNSISAALGMDIAHHFNKEKRVVVAVIGDGAMSGGLAYEGLNNVSGYDNNVLIILNDNKYSIDKNVGGFSRYLSHITTSKHYNNFRWRFYLVLRKLGLMSDAQKSKMLRLSNSIKGLFNNKQNSLFDGFDIRYFGPVDGHDVKNLVRVLNTIKNMTGPKVLHIRTTKGKGYKPAENDATRFHAPGKFDISTGKSIQPQKTGEEPIKFQEVFGQTITELAEKNAKIVAVTPAMPTGCGLHTMMDKFPNRVFDVGIAEGHAVTFSAGLAKEGMIPFCNIYSSFAQRAYDNIIHDVAIPKLPVILCLDRAGLVGEDGVTHQGAFDIAFLRCIPNLTIASPINEHEFRNLMYTAQKLADRPFVIRYPRGRGFVIHWKNDMQEIPVGKGQRLEEGKDIAVATIGPIGLTVKKIIEDFQQENISLSVALYDFRFIKPIDMDLVREIGQNFKKVVTIENGSIEGGFGSALMEAFSEEGFQPKIHRIGLPDHFIEHANVAQQHQMCGMDEDSIRKVLLTI